ncbi:hypothetical protein ABIE00_002819 [Arthrobacter sp. OAP107]
MKKAPEGALHNTKCPHSEAYKPLNRENTCPRWDSNQPLPLKIRRSPKNLPNSAQSDADTTESEALGVDTVHTSFVSISTALPKTMCSRPSQSKSPRFTTCRRSDVWNRF